MPSTVPGTQKVYVKGRKTTSPLLELRDFNSISPSVKEFRALDVFGTHLTEVTFWRAYELNFWWSSCIL